MTEAAAAGKPRRLALYAPFILLAAAILAWTFVWFSLRSDILRRLDAARAGRGRPGWTASWARRSLSGYPFRLDLDLADLRLTNSSGWSVIVPRLKAEAFAFAPAHWVAVAPRGATVVRPRGGPLILTARALRASLSEVRRQPPRLSVEGIGVAFAAPPGARPFALESAAEIHLHTRAGPQDQGAFYVEIDRAVVRLPGLLGRIAAGGPASLILDALYSRADAFAGANWPDGVRAWRARGGTLTVRRLSLSAGRARIDAAGGVLEVGADGRLRGRLDLRLVQAPRTLGLMGEAGALAPEAARAADTVVGAVARGPVAVLPLDFEAGQTTLGPAAIGRAPRIY